MEVNSNIIQFPVRQVPDAEYLGRARHAAAALAHGYTDIGPLHHYGPYKERVSLIRWAARVPSRPGVELSG